MNIENLETYYNRAFNSQLKDLIRREVTKDAWFKPYLRYISYDDEIGWCYLGDTFDNLQHIKSQIKKEIEG